MRVDETLSRGRIHRVIGITPPAWRELVNLRARALQTVRGINTKASENTALPAAGKDPFARQLFVRGSNCREQRRPSGISSHLSPTYSFPRREKRTGEARKTTERRSGSPSRGCRESATDSGALTERVSEIQRQTRKQIAPFFRSASPRRHATRRCRFRSQSAARQCQFSGTAPIGEIRGIPFPICHVCVCV